MRRIIYFTILIGLLGLFSACSSSKLVVSNSIDVNQYEYVVFGSESTGDSDLDDIMMLVTNEITNTRLKSLSKWDVSNLPTVAKILSPRINIRTQYWDGGHTYITISFYDYYTNEQVAVIKSSGIGLSISHDQSLALNAIRKKLQEVFGEK